MSGKVKEDTGLRERLKTVPSKPGIYIFRDRRGRVLYIGKAKNIRNRLRSYFQISSSLDPRKTSMMRHVRDFSFMVTGTELEALALEANLIKEHKPRYNVVLRDDKNYPYLKLTLNEEWPHIEVVRRIKRDGSEYFGPYIPASSMWETLSFIRRHFSVRPCRYRLDKPMRPCIQYQMKRCTAPCAGLVRKEEYIRAVEEVERFLRGEKNALIDDLEQRMFRLSEEMRFEEAAEVRDRLYAVKRSFESQRVIAPELGDLDVIGSYQEASETVFQILFVRNGILISAKDFHLKDTEFIPPEELYENFILLFYAREIIPPEDIVIQVRPSGLKDLRAWLSERRGSRVRLRLPDSDKKRELAAMAAENARVLLQSRKGLKTEDVSESLRERLSLRRLPDSIGAFDVSTIAGSHSVGAFVWWEDGEFRKELYRHLKIKDVKGIDDYSMMREIIKRTVKNLKGSIPDLIMIDGGRGHLDAAVRELSDVMGGEARRIDVIGLAKGPDRAILRDGMAISLDDGSPESLLLRRIRDEAHRFAISFHRKLRGKGFLESRLEKVVGIGKSRRLALLRHFGSIEAIKKASLDEIAGVKGMNKELAGRVLKGL